MPIQLSLIPKPTDETTAKKSGREDPLKKSKKTSHSKSKQRQLNSPSPAYRTHHDSQNEPRDPFSITNYIQDQVHTAVRKIPGVRWFTDNVSHPILVVRETLDKFDESLSPKRTHMDGSWMYPKGREVNKKPKEIDIDSLKRSHKKKVKKERRKMKNASLKKYASRTELRGEFDDSYRETLDDSLADLASPGSENKLFTIENINTANSRLKNRYRPRNLVNLAPNFKGTQDASTFSNKLPTRDEFSFTPRVLKYESERQSGTICTVASFFSGENPQENPQEVSREYLIGPEEGIQIYEGGEIEQNNQRNLSWYPETRTKDSYDSFVGGCKRKRKFKTDVHFIGIEPVVPLSSSEEAITERYLPKRTHSWLKFDWERRGDQPNNCGANYAVRPLTDEQVFETDPPIRNFASQLAHEKATHNGLNDFSDENFLSMPRYVQVLPISDDSNSMSPLSFAEHQSSARKYPKPRMEDEFQGLFMGQKEKIIAMNEAHEIERHPEEFLPTYQAVLGSYGLSSMTSRKYPKSRMEDEFEGLFVGQKEEMGAISNDYEIERHPEEFLPAYQAVSGSYGLHSMFSRKYPKPRMNDEFEGLFDGQKEEMGAFSNDYKIKSYPEEFMTRDVQVLPSRDSSTFSNLRGHQSSARNFPERCKQDEFEVIFLGHKERTEITNAAQKMEKTPGEIELRYVQVLPDCEESHSMLSNLAEQQCSSRKYAMPRMQDEHECRFFYQNKEEGFTNVAHDAESHRSEILPKYFQVLASSTGLRSGFSILDDQPRSAFAQSEGESNDANIIEEDVNSQGEFPVYLLPSARSKKVEKELISTRFENKFNIFQTSDADANFAPTSDGNSNQCDQESEAIVSNQVLERSKLRHGTYEMKHEDTDGKQNNSEIGENSAQDGISEFGENVDINENSELGKNSEIDENFELDRKTDIDNNSELEGKSELERKSGIDGKSGFSYNSELEFGVGSNIEKISEIGEISELTDNSDNDGKSELEGKSELDRNSEFGVGSKIEKISEIREISELTDNSDNDGKSDLDDNSELSDKTEVDGKSDNRKNVATSEKNITNKDIAEKIKEDVEDHNENNDGKSKELTNESVTSEITEDADSKDIYQELTNPRQFTLERKVIGEKFDRLHGVLEKIDSDIDKIDKIINKPLANKNNGQAREMATAPPLTLPPYRRRTPRFRDNILPPNFALVLRTGGRKYPTPDPTETDESGELVRGLYQSLIKCEPDPKPINITSKDLANSTTKTAASLGSYQRQTGHKASSSSKMRKQVSSASRPSKKYDYSTDDSDTLQTTCKELSKTNARFRRTVNHAVTPILVKPSASCDSGHDTGDDTLITEKISTTYATSEAVDMEHGKTPEEILSKKENLKARLQPNQNFSTVKDNRESDEAKETGSEYESNTTDVESKDDETEIDKQAARRTLVSRCLQANNQETSDASDNMANHPSVVSQEAGVSCNQKRPKWYHHFIPCKRLSRVGPSPYWPSPEAPKSTPRSRPVWRHLRSLPVIYGRNFAWVFDEK